MLVESKIETQSPNGHERAAIPSFRDPLSSKVNIRLASVILVLIGMNLFFATWAFVLWFRGPTLVILKQLPNGDTQSISYTGRPVESVDGTVKVQPGEIQIGDRTFYAGEFARLLYAADPSTRASDVERALRMMVPGQGDKLLACLRRGCEEYDLNLDRQRSESWQVVWDVPAKNVWVDQHDPFLVHIIGTQQITKLVNNRTEHETKQIGLDVKLVLDPLGRAARNLQNGVLVDSFQYKLLSSSAQ